MVRKRYTNEVKEKVVKLHQDGKGVSEISKEMGIPTSTIGTWISKKEIVPNDNIPKFIEKVAKETEITVTKDIVTEAFHDKDNEIKRLKDEVRRLEGFVEFIKKEASKEINTLKEAIVILAKDFKAKEYKDNNYTE